VSYKADCTLGTKGEGIPNAPQIEHAFLDGGSKGRGWLQEPAAIWFQAASFLYSIATLNFRQPTL
jgi:hypothetical protein